jgi:hypothetical protein
VHRLRSQFWLVGLLVIAAAILPSCAKERGEPTLYTGKVLTAAEVKAALPFSTTGSTSYAQVSSQWMEWYYAKFRAELSAGVYGVTRWDGAFKCTAFTTRFVADAQLRYFAQSFHAEISNQAPAVALGELWYIPDSSTGAIGHALVVALTEDPAKRYFEPQTGRWVQLTASEQGFLRTVLRKFN